MDSEHATLVANTVKTITLDDDYQSLEVVNVDGVAAVYLTVNGGTPTVAGDGTIVLPAAITGFEMHGEVAGSGATVVRLISAGTPKVSVRGW
jgi:hypothetical protein